MAQKGQPGDVVQLAAKEGGFSDAETHFDISNDEKKKLGDRVGKRTQQAIVSGGLLVVGSGIARDTKARPGSDDDSDLPEDLPGREAFVAAKMTFDQVKKFDFETGKVPGVGPATIENLHKYLKK